MAIHSKTNLYPGINAHLNSFLQQEGGGWESFHAEHIIDLRRVLAKTLPAGYYAVAEKSLQITPLTWLGGDSPRTTRPDITVVRRDPVSKSSGGSQVSLAVPTGVYPMTPLISDLEDDLVGIVVYRQEMGRLPGKPVARIELLSPTNKPPSQDYRQYQSKRQLTLESGVSLVEIDYLHQTPPANPLLPDYSQHEPTAYPYNVSIDIPQPSPSQGDIEHYGLRILDTLPTIRIPLLGEDIAVLDLQTAYTRTFESEGFFDLSIDYALDPPNFARYRPDDQAKIKTLLAKIRA
ncbi:MAG: DUF4058 family protein, partial [Anaerolineae bacterium]|nr:DUF4058 family protein [Anaerolineae bacterium]